MGYSPLPLGYGLCGYPQVAGKLFLCVAPLSAECSQVFCNLNVHVSFLSARFAGRSINRGLKKQAPVLILLYSCVGVSAITAWFPFGLFFSTIRLFHVLVSAFLLKCKKGIVLIFYQMYNPVFNSCVDKESL